MKTTQTQKEFIDGYVLNLKKEGWISSKALERAFGKVPRHDFIERVYQGRYSLASVINIDYSNPEHLALIYSPQQLFIHWPELSVSLRPPLMGLLLEHLALKVGMRVLEIGAGSGYNAALIAELVSERGAVTTIDNVESVAAYARRGLARAGYEAVHVLAKDGFYGAEEDAPYDRIIVTASFMDLSPYWVKQLASDGLMVIPLGHGGTSSCPLIKLEQKDGRLMGRVIGYSRFMPATGQERTQLWHEYNIIADLVKIIQKRSPERTSPVFEGLKRWPNPIRGVDEEWGSRIEFLYFLALHSSKTFIWHGLGIGDRDGFVLIKEEEIDFYGPQAPAVYENVRHLYEQWEALGMPRMFDYEIEFVPQSDTKQEHTTLPPKTWAIERQYYRQIVRL